MKNFVYRWAQAKRWKIFGTIVLISTGFLIYGNTFQSTFQFDDLPAIVENYQIYNLADVHSMWRFYKQRFVGFFTFALNYHFHKLDVVGYHLVNVCIHIGTAFWMWYLLSLTLGLPQFQEKFSKEQRKWLSFLPALLFLVHPIQTQSVTYIYQRVTSLTVFFCLASLCFYVKGRIAHKGYFIPATLAAVLAAFTKELALALPFLIILYEAFFMHREKGGRLRWYYFVPAVAVLFIIPSLYKFNFSARFFTPLISEGQYEIIITIPSYLLTQFRIILLSFQLLIFPYNQNLDHEIPLAKSIMEPVTFLSIAAVLLIVFMSFRLRKKEPLISFGMLWIFITFAYNFVPRDDIFDEQKLYFPAVGFSIALCFAAFRIFKDFSKFVKTIIVIALIFGLLTFQRNWVWQNPLTLWSDVIKKSPHKVRAYNAVGRYYVEKEEKDKALVFFNKALSMRPLYTRPLLNRGIIYFERGFYDLALADFFKVLQISPKSIQAYNNIGQVYVAQGKYDLALKAFGDALYYVPGYLLIFYNRGQLYEKLGQYQKAIEDYTQAISYDPFSDSAYMMRGQIYYKFKSYDLALADFNKALSLNPKLAGLYNNRGNIYSAKGKMQLAFNDFTKAIEVEPSFSMAYNNRGIILRGNGRYDLALNDFNQSLALDPSYTPAYINRGSLLVDLKQYDMALKDFNKALAQNANSAEAYNNRGLVFKETQQYDKALADFDKAVTLAPRFPEIYLNKADIYFLQQKYDLAIGEYDKLTQLYPRSAKIHYLKALLYEKKGDYKQALQELLQAQSLGLRIDQQYLDKLKKASGS